MKIVHMFILSLRCIWTAGMIVCLIGTGASAAVVGIGNTSYTITHQSGFGQTDGLGPKEIPAFILPPLPVPPLLVVEYNETIGDGTNTSKGIAGAGVSFDTLFDAFFVLFSKTTGVDQTLGSAATHDAAVLRIDLDADFDIVGGLSSTSLFTQFVFGGVVSPGGFVAFDYEVELRGFQGELLNDQVLNLLANGPGNFEETMLLEDPGNPMFLAGDGTIKLSGVFEMRAFDAGMGKTSINLLETGGTTNIPLPGGLPLLVSAAGALALLRRRRG